MKATLSKSTIDKLYNIANLTKFMVLERNIRMNVFDGAMKYGTTLKDLPDDFILPITNLPVFLKMCENSLSDKNEVEINYEVEEAEIGLDIKKLYTVTITDGKNKTFNTYESENEEFKSIVNEDKGDKSKITELEDNYISFSLSSNEMKVISSNAKVLLADTLIFKKPRKNKIKCKIFNSKTIDPPIFDYIIEGASSSNCEDFPLPIQMLNVIENQIDYDIIINCEKNAILFANKDSGTFYITSCKKIPK